ncbi:hypothetical protein D3C83_323380 [compost metagenome]
MNDPTLDRKSMLGYQQEVEDARWDIKGRLAEFFTFGMKDTLHGHSGFQKTDVPSAATISAMPRSV